MNRIIEVDDSDVIVIFGTRKESPGVAIMVEVPATDVFEAVVSGKIAGAHSIQRCSATQSSKE